MLLQNLNRRYLYIVIRLLKLKDLCAVPIPHLNMDRVVFIGCCFSCSCCGITALGNVVRVYPEMVQGLTFYRSKI